MIDDLNERGLREMLAAVVECKVPLRVRRDALEAEADLAASAANSLAKVSGLLSVMEDDLRARLLKLEEEK
jgi:hypothetical protein